MRIIDPYYVITLLVVSIGVPVMLHLKLRSGHPEPFNVMIYGSTIESVMLAYYVNQGISGMESFYGKEFINITFVSPNNFHSPDKDIFRRQIPFCGVESSLLEFLKDLNLQYNIKEYGIYFAELSRSQASFQVYEIKEQYPLMTIFKYGLSHFTARQLFLEFEKFLERVPSKTAQYSDEISMYTIAQNLMPDSLESNGISYLSERIGLDQSYLRDFMVPIVWNTYLQEPNSLSVMYKLLPLYCVNNPQIGKSKVIHQTEMVFRDRMLAKLDKVKTNFILNHTIHSYSTHLNEKGDHQSVSVSLKQTNASPNDQDKDKNSQQEQFIDVNANMLFIIEDFEESNVKHISYYRTIVDGLLKDSFFEEEFFTIYFLTGAEPQASPEETLADIESRSTESKYSKNQMFSATRVCANKCKNFNYDSYMLVSKKKPSEKDLFMFSQHHIVSTHKFWHPKMQTPPKKKFQETKNIFRITDTETITDSYEFKLNVFKSLSQLILTAFQHFD